MRSYSLSDDELSAYLDTKTENWTLPLKREVFLFMREKKFTSKNNVYVIFKQFKVANCINVNRKNYLNYWLQRGWSLEESKHNAAALTQQLESATR
jgi:hypothetical protein